MIKRLHIIARYNEDLDWAKDLEGDIVVYNKGENYLYDYKKIDVQNYGRESESYVRGIIDNYSKLEKYDEIVFLQGYPLDHAPELFSLLKNPTNNYMPLGNYFATHIMQPSGYIFDTHKYIIDLLCRQSHIEHDYALTPIVSDFTSKMNMGDGTFSERNHEIKQTMYIFQIMGMPYKNVTLRWNCGAMYSVNVNNITSKSLSWWKELHKLITYWTLELENEDISYILERMWPAIWMYRNNFGGWKF